MVAVPVGRLTGRASPPEDHFGFVDAESVVGRCLQAGRGTHRTVDVDRETAGATDEMVVIVVDPIFVARRRTGRLDPADEASIGQDSEGVVDGLTRYCPDLGSYESLDVVGCPVRRARNRSEDGQPLCRHLHSALAKESGRVGEGVGHNRTMCPILDSVKNSRIR